MMSKEIKISDAFKDGKAFIGFLTAGDPTIEKTVEYVLAMEESGCDLVEIGIPFSDPVAEGPVIQEANLRALANNTNTDDNKEGWSASIKIKDEGVIQCNIDKIESIDFSEDGLYIIINFKDGNSAKYDMSKFESIDFTDNSSKDDGINLNQDYDVLKINGVDYACYGYRCAITYTSTWDSAKNSGEFRLPCGLLSEAQNGKYEYNFMYIIYLKGKEKLKIESKLEDYSPRFENMSDWSELDYVSGSATITDKQNDKYITVKFDSFKFGDGSNSYTLNGSVQLKLDE